jgi:hypothetical protein
MASKAERISTEEECVICAMMRRRASKPDVLLKQRTGVKQTTCSWTHAALLAVYSAVAQDTDEPELVPPEMRVAWTQLGAKVEQRLDAYYEATAGVDEKMMMEELQRQAEEITDEDDEKNGKDE